MTTQIINTLTTVMDENRNIIATREDESYILTPAPNKIIRHTLSGQLFICSVGVAQKHKLCEYEEIDDPKASF